MRDWARLRHPAIPFELLGTQARLDRSVRGTRLAERLRCCLTPPRQCTARGFQPRGAPPLPQAGFDLKALADRRGQTRRRPRQPHRVHTLPVIRRGLPAWAGRHAMPTTQSSPVTPSKLDMGGRKKKAAWEVGWGLRVPQESPAGWQAWLGD